MDANTMEQKTSWWRRRWQLVVMIACIIGVILSLSYAGVSEEANERDRQMMKSGAALALHFADAHFSDLDTDGDGTITPKELEAASKRSWSNEDAGVTTAAIGYLIAYEHLIGHNFPSSGGTPALLIGIDRKDLASWPNRLAEW